MSRKKITIRMDSAKLAELRALAKAEGRYLYTLVEEASAKLLAERAVKFQPGK